LFQAEKVFNQDLYFKKTVKYVGEPMSHLESIASSAVISYQSFLLFILCGSYCMQWWDMVPQQGYCSMTGGHGFWLQYQLLIIE